MRCHPGRKPSSSGLRVRLEGLDRLPIRPATARQVMTALADRSGEPEDQPPDWSVFQPLFGLDPGWVLLQATTPGPFDPIRLVAESPWWPAGSLSDPAAEAFQRLWRHSIAVSIAVKSLAKEAGDPDPERLIRAGLLHGLARWAVAAIDPEWIVGWLGEQDPRARKRREIADLGGEFPELGRRLAQRLGCEPLVIDCAWLHDQAGEPLIRAAAEPEQIALLQRAFRWAESTPWALGAVAGAESMPAEPHLRILVAEVQARCGSLFVAGDATAHEERMTRQTARLTLRLAETLKTSKTQERLLRALAESEPTESAERWASRAGSVWCAEPEVTTARVVWSEDHGKKSTDGQAEAMAEKTNPSAEKTNPRAPLAREQRCPGLAFPLLVPGRARCEIQLWCDPNQPDPRPRLESAQVLSAWRAWAAMVVDRNELETRLQAVSSAVRDHSATEESRLRDAKLDALAEFAAGAGHELNNPLAVIVGRAQLLLARSRDAETNRSLRIILSQAQRSHRILRDLMFVARPQPPRPRACRPSEVLRSCLAGFQEECDARGIRLSSELEPGDSPAWADPDALCHLAETLLRNAIQATPGGGRIQVRSRRQGNELRWSICDSGRGISPAEGAHLFDPFYCGRQAGRGLGLGLPRASRMVKLAGGTLHWTSSIGQGTVFQVQLPLESPPEQSSREVPSDRDLLPPTASTPKN
ncbi:MAG: ATP-binding protein [Isosphaeraceae bacterium]